MKKDRLYFLTFIAITVVFLLVASFGVKYFIKESANQLIELQLSSSVRECNEVSKLIFYQLEQGSDKEKVVNSIQATIQNSNEDISFVSVFDWSGKQVCHPNITKVGQSVTSNQSLLNSLKEEDSSNQLYDLLMDQKQQLEVQNSQHTTEIVHISAISNSDLIVAAHMDLSQLSIEIAKLKKSFYTIFMLMGVLIILSSFFVVRIIGSYYEKQLEQKNSDLESELMNLSKLNTDLVAYQQKVEKNQEVEKEEGAKNDQSKQRILTHIRNELVPVAINEIAFIYTENTITFVVTFSGKKSTTNASLDDLISTLDTSLFFRANRQFIISITSIQKIIKYGNSQLKILVTDADAEIIISKNKASEFRQWLNI